MSRTRRQSGVTHLVFAGLAMLVSMAAPNTANAAETCVDDGDCSGVLLCREGRCVPVHCRHDQQCPAGRMCREELCRLRQCYKTRDCSVGRQCDNGLCMMPPPPNLHRARAPYGTGELAGFRLLAGPSFPVGTAVQIDIPTGTNRWLEVGLGTSLIEGGFSWRLGVRSEPYLKKTASVDLWAAALGYHGGGTVGTGDDKDELAANAGELLTGSGRFLFGANKKVNAMWASAGSGFTLLLGAQRDYLLRIELGAALLFNDRYPADADFAVLPTVTVQGGLAL